MAQMYELAIHLESNILLILVFEAVRERVLLTSMSLGVGVKRVRIGTAVAAGAIVP